MGFNPPSDHFNLIVFTQIVAFAYDLGALFLDPNNFIKILLTLLTVYIYCMLLVRRPMADMKCHTKNIFLSKKVVSHMTYVN